MLNRIRLDVMENDQPIAEDGLSYHDAVHTFHEKTNLPVHDIKAEILLLISSNPYGEKNEEVTIASMKVRVKRPQPPFEQT